MRLNHKGTIGFTGILTAIMLVAHPVLAQAIDTVTLPTEVYGEDVISVTLPNVNEEDSPFDFFIDPQGLIYDTDAVLYGGGIVEKDAHLLFHNRQSEDFDYSRNSDRLVVTNRSTVPIAVTITAEITGLGDMGISPNRNFTEDSCEIYLALVDDEGNEQPVSADGKVSISVEMKPAAEGAYRIDAETGKYEYISVDDEDKFDSYSFGLTGECNADADWEGVKVQPVIEVTWRVEPVLSEDVVDEEDNESVEDIDADSSTDIDTTVTDTTDDKDAAISDDDKQASQDEEPLSEDADDDNLENKPDGDIEQPAQDSSGENEDSSKTSENGGESDKDTEDAGGNAIKTSEVDTSGEAEIGEDS